MLAHRRSGSSGKADHCSFSETQCSLNRLGLFYVIQTGKSGQTNELRRFDCEEKQERPIAICRNLNAMIFGLRRAGPKSPAKSVPVGLHGCEA
jgi:hypothetical protein